MQIYGIVTDKGLSVVTDCVYTKVMADVYLSLFCHFAIVYITYASEMPILVFIANKLSTLFNCSCMELCNTA